MTRIRRIGVTDRAIAGVLADIAHELSSTSDWKARLQNALSLLCDIIPSKIAGLGVQMSDWQVYSCPDVDNIEDLSELLLEHYALLTGEINADNHISMHEAITQGIGELGSFLSMPVIGAGQVLGVLHVRVKQDNAYSREDVSVLSVVALQIGSFIQNVMTHEEEADYRRQRQEIFEREHHIAQMLQQALIPPQVDYEIDGVRIAVKYEPAMKEAEVGGDFYDIFKLKDGKVGILIGDVAGKGLPAAIRVAAARYAVRSYAYLDSSPGLVMTRVNDALCRDEAGDESMLTAIFLVMDTTKGTLAYASGGHEPPMLRSADGSVHELTQGGRVLGVFANYCYEEETRVMEPGDTLVVVTDGITEARSGNDLFGSEGVEKFLKENRHLTPSQTASGLLQAATEKANGALQDDAAIVVLQLT
ncbi:MAG: GAF domain-containing SpoIIE family protein phosphatase [Armatimonadota bacterium]|nr:SpoIIE family protein phosphatase [bacterium]